MEERVVVITGAASGIGRATALRFASRGHRVVGIDVQKDELEETARLAKETGGEFHAEEFDLAQVERIPSLIDRVLAETGRVDILVNNAFKAYTETFLDISLGERWDEQIRVNLAALVALSQCCARDMAKRKWGRIINMSSLSVQEGEPDAAVYAMTKGGIEALTRSMAAELAPLGIRSNCISPAFVGDKHYPPPRLANALKRTPLGRAGRTEEVAAVVEFLASDDADYFLGAVIVIDGGRGLLQRKDN